MKSSTIPFIKLQATGNDFVLIDLRTKHPSLSARPHTPAPLLSCSAGSCLDYSILARTMCDRHFGVGSDGLLIVLDSEEADFRMRFFNPDGTEDMCGNGTRCVVRYAMECDEANQAVYRIETIAGVKGVTGRREGNAAQISVNMGNPSFAPETLPTSIEANPIVDYPLRVTDQTVIVSSISTGTPHTCIFMTGPVEEAMFQTVSPQIENHECFPERTSVLWIQRKAKDHLCVRIWERGIGETLACGTGACAAVVAANMKGIVGRRAHVESRGGVLEIEWRGDGSLIKTGPADLVFRGTWRLDGIQA